MKQVEKSVSVELYHHVVMYLNHTYFGACFDSGFYVRGLTIVLPSSASEFNDIWTDVFGANDKIRVAVLGVNGRGTDHIAGFMNLPDVEVACLCDPDLVNLIPFRIENR